MAWLKAWETQKQDVLQIWSQKELSYQTAAPNFIPSQLSYWNSLLERSCSFYLSTKSRNISLYCHYVTLQSLGNSTKECLQHVLVFSLHFPIGPRIAFMLISQVCGSVNSQGQHSFKKHYPFFRHGGQKVAFCSHLKDITNGSQLPSTLNHSQDANTNARQLQRPFLFLL